MSNVDDRIVLLMTGTVKPNSLVTLAIDNPVERETQYLEALNFYLNQTNFKIVFVENSGIGLKLPSEKIANRLEILVYTAEITFPDRGKGFKEMEIIDYAMENSKFIALSKRVVKITGRLMVLNICSILSDVLINSTNQKNLLVSNVYKLTKMDSRCFCFTKDFWPYLKQKGIKVDVKYSFENALWDAAIEYDRSENNYFKQFVSALRIEGVSGGFGTRYSHGYFDHFLRQIKHWFKRHFVYMNIKNY